MKTRWRLDLRRIAAVLAVLLLIASTSCGRMDDIMGEARDVLDEAGDVVDAIRDSDEDTQPGDGSAGQSEASPSSGGQTVSRPPRPTGTLSTGATTPLASTTVSPAGGSLVIQKPGDPLDGLEIQVPPGSYPDSRNFEVSSAPVDGHTFGEYFTPATPLISIENGGDYSEEFMTVRIPVEIPPDHFAMAFYYDETTGALEGIPFNDMDEQSITIVTRHFCTLLVSIINNTVLDDLMKGDIDSHFRPGVDDWQFTNYGSYIAKGGHCAGQCLSALWYFCEQPDGKDLTLNGRYDKNGRQPFTPDFWEDDSYGYRLASTIQEDINWGSFENKLMENLAGKDDELTYKAFAYGIQLTGEPQEVGIFSSAGGGHDMICYRVHNNSLYIADPNYPGNTERRIEFSNGRFKPYNSGANAAEIAAGNGKAYETIEYCAKSATVKWSTIGARWNEFKAGTIGNDRFPQYNVVVVRDDGKEEALVDGYESDQKKIKLTVKGNFPIAIAVYRNGTKIDRDANGKYELEDGNNEIGIAIWGDVNNNPQSRRWRYVDFKYFNIQHGEQECYGWMLDSVTTENYYEMPSDVYFQNQTFAASETGSFSGSGDYFVYDPDPSGSADDIYAHHTSSGTWTPPPSCIPPDEPVYLDMRCTGTVVFDQNVEWGTLDTYLIISDGTYSTEFGRINLTLDNVTTSVDESIVAEVYMYEGFEGIGPQEVKVRCGTPQGGAEYVYTYVWVG